MMMKWVTWARSGVAAVQFQWVTITHTTSVRRCGIVTLTCPWPLTLAACTAALVPYWPFRPTAVDCRQRNNYYFTFALLHLIFPTARHSHSSPRYFVSCPKSSPFSYSYSRFGVLLNRSTIFPMKRLWFSSWYFVTFIFAANYGFACYIMQSIST